MDDECEIDTGNYQMVGRRGDAVTVLLPRQEMTRQKALLHAAWLVATANPERGEFERILHAVQNT